MKKKLIYSSIILSLSAHSSDNYVVIVDKESNYQHEEFKPVDKTAGMLILIAASSSAEARYRYDVKNTDSPAWNDYFGETKDLVINQVVKEKVVANKTGIVEWFNPDKKLALYAAEGCSEPDYSNSTMEYLNKDNEVVFWTKTTSYGSYGSQVSYGKKADKSDEVYSGVETPYPRVDGIISFDVDTNTVSFDKNNETTAKLAKSWVLKEVDISSIKKINLSYSRVREDYSDGCTALLHLQVLE